MDIAKFFPGALGNDFFFAACIYKQQVLLAIVEKPEVTLCTADGDNAEDPVYGINPGKGGRDSLY